MRVISGSARGRKLLSLEGEATRPTTDRVKESMFNLCMDYVPSAAVLDLFAGSGALGIEALSRGANKCTFVENKSDALEFVRKNLENTRLSERARIYRGDAFSFLENTTETYSLVFLDPPYDSGFYTPVLAKLSEKALLRQDGLVVMEMRADMEISLPEGFSVLKERIYGKIKILLIVTGKKGEERHD